jgi:CheY-like chemotaxis protein
MATILIVEDDAAICTVLTRLLEASGYTVLCAPDGARAVRLAREEQPDLILMDLGLPILNGWQASRRLKAMPATAHIPIVALTAYALAEERERSLLAGCDDFETKPLDIARLLAKIERHVAARARARGD